MVCTSAATRQILPPVGHSVWLLLRPGQSHILPFACYVGSLLSVGRCSCWCRFPLWGIPSDCWFFTGSLDSRFRVRGAQWLVCWGCAGCGSMCRLRVSATPPPPPQCCRVVERGADGPSPTPLCSGRSRVVRRRGRSKGGEKLMGTTAYGGKGSKGRAANGDRPVGAASCRRDHHTMASCQNPPL